MPLVETLAIGLAPTIAKSILNFWLKDNEVAKLAGTGLVDVVKSIVPDTMDQRSAERQLQSIADRIANDMVPVFERSGLSENRQSDIAAEAQTTIDQAKINPELLLKQDLEPIELAKFLIDSRPIANVGFSKFELELYENIIHSSASYIVDIASDFPHFTEHSIAEILRSETYLLNIVQQVLDEFRVIRADDQQDRFERQYREAVVRNLDRVEWFGVDVGAPIRRQRVSVAYVSVSVAGTLAAQPAKARSRNCRKRDTIFPTTPMSLQPTKNARRMSAFPGCWVVRSTRFCGKGTPIAGRPPP